MTPENLNLTFAALADPTRRAILARLARGEASVQELMEPFALSQPAISKHIKVLEHAGLVTRARIAQKRPCQLAVKPLKEAVDWLEHYRIFWTESFDRMDDYMKKLSPTPRKGKPHAK